MKNKYFAIFSKDHIVGFKILVVLAALFFAVPSFGQKYSKGTQSVFHGRMAPHSQLRKGTKSNQVLMTLGDSTLKYVDADTAFSIQRPCRVYTAIVTQGDAPLAPFFSENDPVAIVKENTIGAVTFTRTGVGSYTVNCTGCFPGQENVFLYLSESSTFDNNKYSTIVFNNLNTLSIQSRLRSTGALSDDVLYYNMLEIRVYN